MVTIQTRTLSMSPNMHGTFVPKNFNVTRFTSLHFKTKSLHINHAISLHITTFHTNSLTFHTTSLYILHHFTYISHRFTLHFTPLPFTFHITSLTSHITSLTFHTISLTFHITSLIFHTTSPTFHATSLTFHITSLYISQHFTFISHHFIYISHPFTLHFIMCRFLIYQISPKSVDMEITGRNVLKTINFNQLDMFRAIVSPILRSASLCLQLEV